MSLIIIALSVIMMLIIARMGNRGKDHFNVEVLPPTKLVEVEVIDEMTKEKIRNLYDKQDIYNAKISYLMRENKLYQQEINELDEKIQKNLDDMRMQLSIQPDLDINILKAGYETSIKNINKHKLKLEGAILTNMEKIVSYKDKSNAISGEITKIGKEIYAKQRGM